jgi:hypothetical protein
MRIIWNSTEQRFEAELTLGPEWASDKESVSQNGFRCAGPPLWIWSCTKPGVLTLLRENRPKSGLTITPEALQQYDRLKAQDDTNAAVKASLDVARKAQKKEQKYQQRCEQPTEDETVHGSDFDYIRVEPGESRIWSMPIIFAPPTTLCHVCRTPVYFHECQDPPTCLECEFSEIRLDIDLVL